MNRLINLFKQSAFATTADKKYRYSFKYGSYIIPHPEKAFKGGQDAVFVSPNVLLVADGVGGWAESGVDPALYSKRLAKIIQDLVKQNSEKYINDPKELVKQAVLQNKQTGSTTVCLLTLNPNNGILRAYYLGDSVYAILNPESESCRVAQQQQIQFNFPVQVGTHGHSPQQGVYHEYPHDQILANEYIVVGSDGIWDNLHLNSIFNIVCRSEDSLLEKAKKICQMAYEVALRTNYQSPFYLKAKQAGIRYPKKGKLDDNSVIVAQIIQEYILNVIRETPKTKI